VIRLLLCALLKRDAEKIAKTAQPSRWTIYDPSASNVRGRSRKSRNGVKEARGHLTRCHVSGLVLRLFFPYTAFRERRTAAPSHFSPCLDQFHFFLCSYLRLRHTFTIHSGTRDIPPSTGASTIRDLRLTHRPTCRFASYQLPPPMSFPATPFPFFLDKPDPSITFRSPPPSVGCGSDSGLDFDLDSFTLCSPGSNTLFDDLNALSPIASTSPDSTILVSPKSSIADVGAFFPVDGASGADAVEALSNHHLERYLHYKALADQAEVDARAQQLELDVLLAACSMPDEKTTSSPYGSNMLAYQTTPSQQYIGGGQMVWEPSFAFQSQQSAAMAHVQAQAHMQAHDAAMARSQSATMSYYMSTMTPVSTASNAIWSRQSTSTQSSTPSPFLSTPTYSSAAPVMATPLATSTSSLSMVAAPPIAEFSPEGENELDDAEKDQASLYSRESPRDLDVKPIIAETPVPNSHGGGRGYVPGKTPEDPSKRHKCKVCGRGFARAFNLKVS
jgi:hypothetical protein